MFSKGKSVNESYFQLKHNDFRNLFHQKFLKLKDQSMNKKIRVAPKIFQFFSYLSEPIRLWNNLCGHEDFSLPGTKHIIEQSGYSPDIIHAHNLHSDFVDLRELTNLSNNYHFFLTLHDCWMFTGHCCHFFDCNRWRHQCGECPHLKVPMQLKRDGTKFNLRQKREIFENCKFHIATPSKWLADQVGKSILKPAIKSLTVIPNGIDLSIFKPSCKDSAKSSLGIAQNRFVISFSCNSPSQNPWKNYQLLEEIIETLNNSECGKKISIVILGESGKDIECGHISVKKIDWMVDPVKVAEVYQASDIYLHVSKADTYPSVVMEAMACGTPVVASRIGGIPEQISNHHDGILLPNDAKIFAKEILSLISDESRLKTMKEKALEKSNQFNQDKMISNYYKWYDHHKN